MFQKYKYVLAVYKEQSITGAAQKLFISQPSLSVAIRSIEKKIGGPLFERSGFGVRPTEIGKAYIAAAQKMQFAEDAFQRQFEDISGLQTGKLVIGGSNYLSSDVIPQLVSRFRRQYPGVEIVLVEANSVHLREMLSNEDVDLVIDNFENFPEIFERYPLIDEHIMLCLPGDRSVHQSLKEFQILPESIYTDPGCLKQVSSLDISVFKDEPFVLLKSGNDMYDRAMQMFDSVSVVPHVVFCVDQLNISYALAESGSGACFITNTFFRYRKHITNMVLYKLEHQLARRTLHIAHKKNRYCTRAMSEFIQVAQEIINSDSLPDNPAL